VSTNPRCAVIAEPVDGADLRMIVTEIVSFASVVRALIENIAAVVVSSTVPAVQTISVDEFFQYYNQLFFEIPKEGTVNSHEYLVKTSSEYINFTATDDSIQALIEEVNLILGGAGDFL
jgi:hypothetical protein